jgi:ech hydrogenase subunit D
MIERIKRSELKNRVWEMKNMGYRLVTMSSVDTGEDIEYIYHFDKNLNMVNFAISVPHGESPESISEIYGSALLVENEIQDHFGVSFTGLALDFKGSFFLEDEVQKAPFCAMSIKRQESNAEGNE